MKIFCHRGKFGCTDIGQEFLREDDVKGDNLKNLPPENSEESITDAFESGFGVEIDVVMTKDKHIIVTHTNDLFMHSPNAIIGDFASNKTLEEIKTMKTGLGGKIAPFLTYNRFIEIFEKYDNLSANIEIKGTIQPKNSLIEPTSPSLVEQLLEKTPARLLNRIIWSSFANSNIYNMQNIFKDANVAQLFCNNDSDGFPIYPNTDDRYLAFNLKNLKMIYTKMPNLNAVHPPINSLYDDEVLKFCAKHNLTIRAWVLGERNPAKNIEARKNILNILDIKNKYPNLDIDIITDFSDEVSKIINLK